jgi:hypothetical protein
MTQEAMHRPNIVLNGVEPPNFASATQIDPTGVLSSKLRATSVAAFKFVEALRTYPRTNYRANKTRMRSTVETRIEAESHRK